jgi:putative ABC transport system permease protein
MNAMQLIGAVEIGLIYALVAIAVYISFRIIDFPDLTVDGSFTLGASVAACMIASGYPPVLSTIVAICCGMLAGFITGYLHVKWHIMGLLAGILTMTALYSINLRIMGKPNISIINEATLFSYGSVITVSIILVMCSVLLLSWLFATDFGLSIRAVGLNARVSLAYGISVNKIKIFTLALSNGLVALAGALFAQSQGFADITMGTGTIIVGLAAVMIGEAICHPQRIYYAFIACVIGSIIYRSTIALALHSYEIGLQASDLNFLTALLVTITMVLPTLKKMRLKVQNDKT